MNTLVDASWNVPATDELSLESALAACGWDSQGSTCWRLATEGGDSLLMEVAHRDRWRQFQLSGGATPKSTNSRVLQDNCGLLGPAKLVAGPGDRPICRLDVPEDLSGSPGEAFAVGEDYRALDSRFSWVRAVTRLAKGGDCDERSALISKSAIAAELKQAGWSASVDDGQVVIHLQMPGVYRQLTLECDERAGVTLAADMIALTDLEAECVRAMLLLAQEANSRLPLVRMAVAESTARSTLRAEVSFGLTPIPGSLLLHSLYVFETAVALTARELEALRDAELARLVLSAAAARSSAGYL